MEKVNYKNKILGSIATSVLVLSTFSTGINTFAAPGDPTNGTENQVPSGISMTYDTPNSGEKTINDTSNSSVEDFETVLVPVQTSLKTKNEEISEKKKPKKNTDKKTYDKQKAKKCLENIAKNLQELSDETGCSKEKILNMGLNFVKNQKKQLLTVSTDLNDNANLEYLLKNQKQTITRSLENSVTVSLRLHKSGFWPFSSSSLVIECSDKDCKIELNKEFLQILANNNITYIVSETQLITNKDYRWENISSTQALLPNFHTSFPNALAHLGSQQPKNYYHYQTTYSI